MLFRFGPFELDDALCELRRDGGAIPVQRKTFDLLAHLVRARGSLVTRHELLEKVWPGVVVSEQALSQAILSVRKRLGDEGAVVKTVRGRGYRIAADVVASLEGAGAGAGANTPLVLVLDDMHWADMPSLDLLTLLAQDLPDARVLMIVTPSKRTASASAPTRRRSSS